MKSCAYVQNNKFPLGYIWAVLDAIGYDTVRKNLTCNRKMVRRYSSLVYHTTSK